MHPNAATILAVEGDMTGQFWRFQSGVPIGRGPRNCLRFPDDETLHDHHCGIVIHRDDRWYVINSNPEAPTFVDGEMVSARFTLIRSGSIVRCGRQALRVTYREPKVEYRGSAAEESDNTIETSARAQVSSALRGLLKRN